MEGGDGWIPYAPEHQELLEEAFEAGLDDSIDLTVANTAAQAQSYKICVDFDGSGALHSQFSKKTGQKRRIRRILGRPTAGIALAYTQLDNSAEPTAVRVNPGSRKVGLGGGSASGLDPVRRGTPARA